jgi:dipeptidyl aminopeptidase/acylaminoacyl peptidase
MTIGFTRQTLAQPMEAHVSGLDPFQATPVSHVNADLPKHPLPRTELVRWKSSDGSEIEGLLTYPNEFAPGRRYPRVILVRSGSVVFQRSFVANPFQEDLIDYWPVTDLALQGYIVLQCNSRGGVLAGYGPEYSRPIAKPREKSHPDVMAALDHVVGMGIVDTTRVGIGGISNGGLVTSWAISHSGRFKAAIINAGGPDLLGAFYPWMTQELSVAPWEDIRRYVDNSPLPHFGSITTSTLIMVGDRDWLLEFNLKMHRALQGLGVPTEMVIYPGEGHVTSSPNDLIDIGRRTVAWFDRYLR